MFVAHFVYRCEDRVFLCVLCAFVAGGQHFESFDESGFEFGVHVVAFGLIGLLVNNGVDHVTMEVFMSAVKRVVRDGFSHGPDFDPGLDCSVDPDTGEVLVSLTKQNFAEECDINNIMRRMAVSGVDPYMDNRARGQFADASTVVDFAAAMNIVIEAEYNFSTLPAVIRDRFGNDPANLLRWLDEPENRDEAIELGIVNAPPEEDPPTRVSIVDPPPQPKPATPASGAAGTAAT